MKDRDNVYNWYNAYFHVNFTFGVFANSTNVSDTRSALINSAFPSIKSMTVKSAGKTVYKADDVHKVIFIKNLLDFSEDYARSVMKSQFWFLCSNASHVTAAAKCSNPPVQAALSLGRLGWNSHPLNCYLFFEELSDKLLPPMQLEFEIVLQNEAEMIFHNNSTEHRIVVWKFELWIPQLTLTSEGQKLVNENLLKLTQWSYLKEILHPSSSQRDASSSWSITPSVKNPRYVFVFFQQAQKKISDPQSLHLGHL